MRMMDRSGQQLVVSRHHPNPGVAELSIGDAESTPPVTAG